MTKECEKAPSNVVSLNTVRQKRDRCVSVEDVLDTAIREHGGTKSIIILSEGYDGIIRTTYSYESSLEMLGILEVAKSDILDLMRS